MKKKLILAGLLVYMCTNQIFAQISSSYNGNAGGIGVSDCTGFGLDVLNGTPNTASGQTGAGYQALHFNSTGEFNTGIGNQALYSNTTGNNNTATGYQALYNNNTSGSGGNNNTAIGRTALYSNDNGDYNTACGDEALYYNIGGLGNTADGYRALRYNSGVSGNYGNYNSAFGFAALYGTYDGDYNTAVGVNALYNNGPGINNTALGAFALKYPNNGASTWNNDNNTAVGYASIYGYPTTSAGSSGNTAIGNQALFNASDGVNNTACGYFSQYVNNSASENVSMGDNSFRNSQTGIKSVALGSSALYSFNGTSAGKNVAIGNGAQYYNVGYEENVAVGASAMIYYSPDKQNTMVGAYSDLNGNYKNSSALGAFAFTHQSNMVRVGDVNITNIDCAVNYSGPSDGRFKFDISEKDVVGLDFISKLKPVSYDFDNKKLEEFLIQDMAEDVQKIRLKRDFNKPGDERNSGFIAQEVEEAMNQVGFNFNGLKKPVNERDIYELGYGLFVVPLVKALQEQQEIIAKTKESNKAIEDEIANRSKVVLELQSKLSISNYDIQRNNQSLEINIPNPFNQVCTLNYKVPEGSNKVFLKIYNLVGSQIKSIQLNDKGSASVTINSKDLDAGLYLYTLVADGEILGQRTMMVSNR